MAAGVAALFAMVLAAAFAAPAGAQTIDEAVKAFQSKDYASAYRSFRAIAEGRASPSPSPSPSPSAGTGSALDRLASSRAKERAAGYLSQMYLQGLGMARSDSNAATWAERAAQGGDANAAFNFARFHEQGIGVPTDHERARQWYRRAGLEGGYLPAQLRLAEIYDQGIGIEPDPAEAAFWYHRAADRAGGLGDPNAMFRLAQMYDAGIGVKQDRERSRTYLRQAAGVGHPVARHIELEEKAFAGDGQTMFQVGLAYFEGRAIERDLPRSHVWLSLAARHPDNPAQMHDMARRLVLELEKHLTAEQIAASKQNVDVLVSRGILRKR